MPPKKRGLTPPRNAAKKPVRTLDSSKPASMRGNKKNVTNIRSLSPGRNYSGTKPSTIRQGSSASIASSDDSAGSGGPLWKMPRPRRGGSEPAPAIPHPQKKAKRYNSTPSTTVKPSSVNWQRNAPTSKSESDKRTAGRGRSSVIIDISSSEEGSDSDDSSIEILVPPKPQSSRVTATRPPAARSSDKRKSMPSQNDTMNDRKAAQKPQRAVSPSSPKSTSGRSGRSVQGRNTNVTRPLKRLHSLNEAATASTTPSDRSRSTTAGDRSRARSHSPVLINEKPKRGASKKQSPTVSPVVDITSPNKQKKSAAAKLKKKLSPEGAKKEHIRPISPVQTKSNTSPLPPTLSPPFKDKRAVAHDRRQSTAVDGRAARDKSPVRNQLPGRRVASMATEEHPPVPPSRPSNPAPSRNAPAVPPGVGFANNGPTMGPPQVGRVDPRRQTVSTADGRPVRERSPNRNRIPGRRVASVATDETHDPNVPQASQLNLGGGLGGDRPASGSRMPGRRVASMAADARPPPIRRPTGTDDMQLPKRRSMATEDIPRGRPPSVRMGGSRNGRSPPPRSVSAKSPTRPSSGRSPPPRSSSGRGGGRGRGGQSKQREFESIGEMPASLKNRYGAQLGRFASSGGRAAGGRGGRSVFSGRVTADGRKVPLAPPPNKNKIVLGQGGAPVSASGRAPMGPGRGRGRQAQSTRAANPVPMGRKKKRDSGSSSAFGSSSSNGLDFSDRSSGTRTRVGLDASDRSSGTRTRAGLDASDRSSGTRSATSVPRPGSPMGDPNHVPKKKIYTKIRPDEPFMFPIDDVQDIVHDIVQPGGSVRILICSANLGNAQPDELSLNEWIPVNGNMSHVLTNPRRYPVMLNFPSEDKDDGNIGFTDRAVYTTARSRQSDLFAISEDIDGLGLDEDSENFSLPAMSQSQAFVSQMTVETVDEEADDDDQSVIYEDTLDVTRGLRKLSEKKPEIEPEIVVEEPEVSEVSYEAEPEVVESLEPSKAIEETKLNEETEAIEPEDVAVPDTVESSTKTDVIEEAEVTETETEDNIDPLINSQRSVNSDGIAMPRRYTASSKKLDSIRQRIEDSIKKSQTDGFAFGDAFHERQRILAEAEKLKNQEARENLHLGSMAPDKASTISETFLVQQTATKTEEREKQKATKDMTSRGSIGPSGRRKKKSADQGSSSLSPQTPQKNNIYLQAMPAAINVSPKSPSQSEENASSSQISIAESDGNGSRLAEGTESLDTTAASDAVTNPELDNAKSAVDDDLNRNAEDSTPASDSKEVRKNKVKPLNAVAQSQEKESDSVAGLEPSSVKEDPKNNSEVVESKSNGAFDAVGEVDDLENEGSHNDGDVQGGAIDYWENNDETVEPEPYYEEGPEGHFEIIVIGMQEATFDPNKDPDAKEPEKVGSERSSRTVEGSDSEGSDDDVGEDEGSEDDGNEDGEDDEADDSDDEGRNGSSEEDIDDAPQSSTSLAGSEKDEASAKKSKLLSIAKKAGKGAMKAGKGALGKGAKKLKAARKTSKAVKTLMSARNHTKRELPFLRQETSPSEDGAMAKWEDTDVLHFLFEGQLPSYDRALSYQLGEMRLMVYYLKTSVKLDVLSVKAKPTGKANLANKGGIVTEVAVNGATRLCFSSAHLEAHEGEHKFEKRCKSFERIFNAAHSSVTALNFDPTMASHYSFFMGDLNFRTKLPHLEPGSDEHIQASHALTAARNWSVLNRHDELSNALLDNKCLAGWKTPYCNFDPTFKVARQDGYAYNVLRSPSYTDRILYKAIDQLEDSLEVSLYEPITHFTSSDHKPVRGAFEIQLNEKLDLKPRQPTLKKERLHILFTSIELSLYSAKYKQKTKPKSDDEVVKPNPFVSFISTPRDALELDASSRKRSAWKSFGQKKSFPRTKPGRTKSDVGSSKFNPLSTQWPGTSVMESTFNPTWKNDEIHFELGMKNKTNNRPLDLSGALMHVSVFDQRDSNLKPLGSFTLNLASLIKVTKEPDKSRRGGPMGGARPGRGGMGAPAQSFRGKLSKQPSRRLSGLLDSLADELEDNQEAQRLKQLKITTLKFDEALVESGVQTGDIKCTVDAWWMHDAEEEE
ncbi:unnamed protein product [Cylindrotheca closterium]|uniref:Inositol polyphosphate-related phosphatase domain-containing protein n=1 Tax=Cylindrotheca closterium TaxID=2856 RepID=A0AAD2FD03_9STRA|nr:unnamed protein product [Cylindrotheca closterium]